MQKALITGGAGFIGSNLAQELIKNYHVTIIDNLSSGALSNIDQIIDKVEFIKADIREDLSPYFKGVNVVFHLAANVFVNRSVEDPIFDADTNIMGTLNILEECRKNDIKRFVFSSSCAIYGNPSRLPIAENQTAVTMSPYAVAKLTGEHYCQLYYELYGLETVALRYFNVYGKNQRNDSPYSGVISIFVDRILKNRNLTVYGDGKQTRDFINVDDVIKANILATASEKAVGKVINIGTGKKTSLNELIYCISSIVNKNPEVIYDQPRLGDIKHSVAEVSLAKRTLGFGSAVSLRDGLKKFIEFQTQQLHSGNPHHRPQQDKEK